MNIFADENVDRPIVERLKKDGHEVWYVFDIERGMSDDEVINRANQYNAILFTIDKDFGELVFRKKLLIPGVLLIRLAGLPNHEKAEIVSNIIKQFNEKLYHSFSVVTKNSIRIRNI